MEAKSTWMNIFDNIKQRIAADILFLSIDGVLGGEARVKAIYTNTVVQRYKSFGLGKSELISNIQVSNASQKLNKVSLTRI